MSKLETKTQSFIKIPSFYKQRAHFTDTQRPEQVAQGHTVLLTNPDKKSGFLLSCSIFLKLE